MRPDVGPGSLWDSMKRFCVQGMRYGIIFYTSQDILLFTKILKFTLLSALDRVGSEGLNRGKPPEASHCLKDLGIRDTGGASNVCMGLTCDDNTRHL